MLKKITPFLLIIVLLSGCSVSEKDFLEYVSKNEKDRV